MRKIKIFKTIENDLMATEREINNWIEKTDVEVVSVTGNIASQTPGSHVGAHSASDVLVIVLYEERTTKR
jgi:hypothetical protein